MDVIPAIDLIGGKCVRLVQGEYHRQITYEDDPIKQAGVFRDAGAQWLHIVDLDGARMGRSVNFEVIKAITSHYDMNVEVGGGIRDEAAIRRMLDAGVKRVIIGTSAVSNFAWFAKMAQTYPGKLAFGLDAGIEGGGRGLDAGDAAATLGFCGTGVEASAVGDHLYGHHKGWDDGGAEFRPDQGAG